MFKYKKTALTIAVLLFSTTFGEAYSEVQPLSPGTPKGWTGGELRTVSLDTVSGNQGFWLERDYRTENGVPLKAISMGGKGPATRFFPAPGLESSDGPLGAGKTYKTFTVGDYPAVLERDPLLGLSLAVKTPDATLTLETPSRDLSDLDMAALAKAILALP
jgi:hypothetical protein